MNFIDKAVADGKRAAQRKHLWRDNSYKKTVWDFRRHGIFEPEVIVDRWRPSIFWRLKRAARRAPQGA